MEENNTGKFQLIEPKVLKGFRDFLPPVERVRRNITEKIETVFRLFGFVPIDTPALEYAEILLGKGGGETEKQIYRFTDNGGRDVALRFDLTVPFARFVAAHTSELVFPFKRYHIGKVWRGENTQRGRYREFTQCDFDSIGNDSSESDFEIVLLIYETLRNLGLDTQIKINHRGLFNRFLDHIGCLENSVLILRAVDKMSKVGFASTRESLNEIVGEVSCEKILAYIKAGKGNFDEALNSLTELSGGPSSESKCMQDIGVFAKDAGILDSIIIDPAITRGLDYYTGVVFETFLTELPEIGSICSGGRYDNLAGLYSKNAISGVGASIGLDRMISALESLDKLPQSTGYAKLAIVCVCKDHAGAYQALAGKFRLSGIPCEVLFDDDDNAEQASGQKKFKDNKELIKQFMLAEKKGHSYVIIPGKDPLNDNFALRKISSRQTKEDISLQDACDFFSGDDIAFEDLP